MHRLAAILIALCALCALIGAPPSAMARTVSSGKTASGIFSATSSHHARPESPQVLDRVPETPPRDYDPASGRPKWLSRDPIGEEGGVNILLFNKNESVNRFDILGLRDCECNKKPKAVAVSNVEWEMEHAMSTFGGLQTAAAAARVMGSQLGDGECIKNLRMVFHGNTAGFSFSSNERYMSPVSSTKLSEANRVNSANASEIFGKFANMFCFCEGCTIYLDTCSTGQAHDVLAKIGEATAGCAVYAHNRCAYPGKDQRFGDIAVDPWAPGVGTPFDNTAYRPSGWSGSGISEF